MTLDSQKLHVFLVVAKEKSFSKAAEILFRTQPAVSQSIRALEDELGERLFLRAGRTNVLTQAGRILKEHAEEAFAALDRGRMRIESLKELKEGELVISASDTTSYYVLPKVLSIFRRQYPGVEVRILNRPSPVSVEQVAAHESDIGIVTLPVSHPDLMAEPISTREDVAICAPNHPLAQRPGIKFEDLLSYPLILLDTGSNTRSFIDQRLGEMDVRPNISMEIGSIEVIKKLVQLDFGVSIVPRISVMEEARQGILHYMSVFDRSEWRKLGVIYPRKGLYSLAAQVFVKMLKKELSVNAAI